MSQSKLVEKLERKDHPHIERVADALLAMAREILADEFLGNAADSRYFLAQGMRRAAEKLET